jgi:hypothetical protein
MGAANGYTLLLVTPLAILAVMAFAHLHSGAALEEGYRWFFAHPLRFALLFVSGILGHELLHGLAWKWATGKPWSTIRFGFQWKTVTPFAHCTEPMNVRSYRIGAATPGLLIGVLPVLAGLIGGNGSLFIYGLVFTAAAGGDAIILLTLRGEAGHRLVVDHPSRAGCLVVPEEDEGASPPSEEH